MSTPRSLPRAVAVLVLLALPLLLPASVAAHAELESTTPEAGSTIEGSPSEIAADFSEALEADGSGISLRDADGAELAAGGLDPDDAARLLIADVPDLPPGTYEVRWTVATDDGHVERDTWTFTVTAPPSPSPTIAPTAAPTDSPAPASAAPTPTVVPSPATTSTPPASPAASTPPDDGPTGSGSDVILPIVAGLAIVLGAGAFLLSRRGRAA